MTIQWGPNRAGEATERYTVQDDGCLHVDGTVTVDGQTVIMKQVHTRHFSICLAWSCSKVCIGQMRPIFGCSSATCLLCAVYPGSKNLQECAFPLTMQVYERKDKRKVDSRYFKGAE